MPRSDGTRYMVVGRATVHEVAAPLHVADPRFDDWPVVRDFEDLPTAQAWRQHVEEAGIEAVLTADWPLDGFGRGDIALRVPPGDWSDADAFLDGL
jgi:hypothetical protein